MSTVHAAQPAVSRNWRHPWRGEAVFDAELAPYREAADRLMLGMCLFLQGVCLLLAPLHGTWLAAVLWGGGTLAMGALLVRARRGALATRLYLGCAFMVYTALVIHQTGGSIEGHFTAFGLIGVLLYYRDWRVIAAATLFIYAHHLVLGWAQVHGLAVYVFDTREFWAKFVVHVAYFLPFVALMGYLAVSLRREGHENRLVIRLAREVASGDFTRDTGLAGRGRLPLPLLDAVLRMRSSMVDLLHAMPTPVMILRMDSETVADVNEAWQRMFGLAPAQVLGLQVAKLPLWLEEGPWSSLRRQLERLPGCHAELAMQRADGRRLRLTATAVEHSTEALRLWVVAFEDVTLRREAERRMHRLAFHDLLTGLPNRAALFSRLAEWLEHRHADRRSAQGEAAGLAVVLLDLDDFKPVNDTLGHGAGDLVLQTVARRIDEARRNCDFAARLGGDEFVVVLPHCAEAALACAMARRIIDEIDLPVALPDGVAARVGATAGVVWFAPEVHPGDVNAALALADEALYEAKSAGKGRVRLSKSLHGVFPRDKPARLGEAAAYDRRSSFHGDDP